MPYSCFLPLACLLASNEAIEDVMHMHTRSMFLVPCVPRRFGHRCSFIHEANGEDAPAPIPFHVYDLKASLAPQNCTIPHGTGRPLGTNPGRTHWFYNGTQSTWALNTQVPAVHQCLHARLSCIA